ncbi:ketopantoate reductase family protein [Candidatus Woesearchaeota archaeon]|nr:ketopantoate reductase family protein [Candidatus Woesearchaeota archaeon]
MKIMVLGAGAVGSLYGAKLSKLNDVTLIARKEHADRIKKYGLKITGLEDKTYWLKTAAKINKIEYNTLILLTTKVYDSEKAIGSIKNLIKKGTVILCLQNGLYSENIAKKILKNKCLVLRAITNFGAVFLEPGAVKYNSCSYTAIEKSQKSREIAGNFKKCGLNGYVSESIKADMWKKLILNCVLNPVTAILKVENKAIADESLNPLKKLIVGECLKVAKRDGLVLKIDFVKAINKEFKGSMNISSMQQDLMKGKQTEIDYLNGAVVKLGGKYGIKCPVNEALAEIIKEMEKKR